MRAVVVAEDDLRAILTWFDGTAGDDWVPTPPTSVLVARDRLWRTWDVPSKVEYGLRFICDGMQEGHEGHSKLADYFDIQPRDSRPDAAENRGTINGHAVEVVQRTVSYGPWEPSPAARTPAGPRGAEQ